MKVTQIKQQTYKDVKGNDKTSYWTEFEGEERTLFTPSKPLFTEGSDIPVESLEVKTSKKGKEYFVIPDKPKSEPAKPEIGVPPHKDSGGFQRYQKDDDAIMLQVAFKGVVELDTHHIVPEGKVNCERVLENTFHIYAGLQLIKAGTYHEKVKK
jgi:hypothetical protein